MIKRPLHYALIFFPALCLLLALPRLVTAEDGGGESASKPVLISSAASAPQGGDEAERGEDKGLIGGIAEGKGVLALFESGGLLMWPILLCSVITLTFILERAMGLRTNYIYPAKLRAQLLKLAEGRRTREALELCRQNRSPFAALMRATLMRAGYEGFEMEAALEEAGARLLYDLRRNCKPLAVMADVAPLLGLMGTVTGMIKAFDVVAKSGALGRTELLAAGIAEALLTTAFGLLVAVPALVAYHIYRAKAENLLRDMEDSALEILATLRLASDSKDGGDEQ